MTQDEIRKTIRSEIARAEKIKERRKQLQSVYVSSADFAGYPALPPLIPSLESISAGIKLVEKKLREEFGEL